MNKKMKRLFGLLKVKPEEEIIQPETKSSEILKEERQKKIREFLSSFSNRNNDILAKERQIKMVMGQPDKKIEYEKLNDLGFKKLANQSILGFDNLDELLKSTEKIKYYGKKYPNNTIVLFNEIFTSRSNPLDNMLIAFNDRFYDARDFNYHIPESNLNEMENFKNNIDPEDYQYIKAGISFYELISKEEYESIKAENDKNEFETNYIGKTINTNKEFKIMKHNFDQKFAIFVAFYPVKDGYLIVTHWEG